MTDVDQEVGEPAQLPRFGALREVPPASVVAMLPGAADGTAWRAERLGVEGGFPNGGMWRVAAERRASDGPSAAVVKRTGPAHLGTSAVWRSRIDPADPQWWGREAEFYTSDLAVDGWTEDVRAARAHVDDHDGCRDLWLEEVDGVPADFDIAVRAVAGLAHWQVAHAGADHGWLSRGWIAAHVGRYRLDNARTLAHPAWAAAVDRGVDPALRAWAETRPTDPEEIAELLAGLPHAPTNHDFHTGNIGTVGGRVVIFDWSYVGWGPIGHDAGHLAFGTRDPERWRTIVDTYCAALAAAGWPGPESEVRRALAISTRLRLGWTLDHLLDNVDRTPDPLLTSWSTALSLVATLE